MYLEFINFIEQFIITLEPIPQDKNDDDQYYLLYSDDTLVNKKGIVLDEISVAETAPEPETAEAEPSAETGGPEGPAKDEATVAEEAAAQPALEELEPQTGTEDPEGLAKDEATRAKTEEAATQLASEEPEPQAGTAEVTPPPEEAVAKREGSPRIREYTIIKKKGGSKKKSGKKNKGGKQLTKRQNRDLDVAALMI